MNLCPLPLFRERFSVFKPWGQALKTVGTGPEAGKPWGKPWGQALRLETVGTGPSGGAEP